MYISNKNICQTIAVDLFTIFVEKELISCTNANFNGKKINQFLISRVFPLIRIRKFINKRRALGKIHRRHNE